MIEDGEVAAAPGEEAGSGIPAAPEFRDEAEHGSERELRWRLRSIIEGTNVGSWEWNVQTGETRFNERWAEIVGYRLDELQPSSIQTWASFAHPDDLGHSNGLLERHFAGELPYYDVECRMRHREGHWVWVHDRGRVFSWTDDGKPEWMFGTHQDLTERRDAEEQRRTLEGQLLRAQKLESLGVLAGGVAHDFNNILGAIRGFAELARMDVDDVGGTVELLDELLRGVDRATSLTRQMLAFAGDAQILRTDVDMNTLVRDTADLLRSSVSRSASFDLVLAAELPLVSGDTSQLQQLVMNLVTNASEALAGRSGSIELHTRAGTWNTDAADTGFDTVVDGDHIDGDVVIVEVSDTGPGMAAEVVERILEPFFTTKQTGRGLGLAAASGILKGHDGALLVRTAPDHGTTFRILLPALHQAPPTAQGSNHHTPAQADSPTHPQLLAGLDVLVVDDEPALRHVVSTLLRRQGAHVASACDGLDALDKITELGTRLDAVVLDITMPNMDGLECLRSIRARHPHLPVVLTSGYSAERTSTAPDLGPTTFLAKPFTAEQLLTKLAEHRGHTLA